MEKSYHQLDAVAHATGTLPPSPGGVITITIFFPANVCFPTPHDWAGTVSSHFVQNVLENGFHGFFPQFELKKLWL